MEKISIKEEYIKLDSLLKFSGIAETGGHAKIMIQNSEVFVNGEICTQRGKKIRKGDRVKAEGKEIIIE